MRLSMFNVYYHDENSVIIYNTFSGAVVRLSKRLYNKLIDYDYTTLDPEYVSLLLKFNILTQLSAEEEFNYVVQFLNELKKKPKLYVTFSMTFRCNFKCIYCIQGSNYISYPTITKSIIDETINWIAKYVKLFNIQDVSVDLFGGEPSLVHDKNLYLLAKLKEKFEKKIDYIQMVTNGYFYTKAKIRDLFKNGVRAVQITIDGPPHVHNLRRPLMNGSATFDRILNNLLAFKEEGFIINILTVVDMQNAAYLQDMIDIVYDKFEHELEGVYWAFGPVVPDIASIQHIKNFYIGKEEEILKRISKAKSYAKTLGFNVNDDYHITTCFREFHHAYLVSPDGYLYKCYSTFGNRNYAIGSVKDSPKKIFEIARGIADINPWDSECMKCQYFPICRGGCQYMASLENNGKYGAKWCDKDNLEKMIKNDLHFKVFGD